MNKRSSTTDYLRDGRVAVVTGAGRGIGKAIAVELGSRGVTVCCLSRTYVQVADTVDLIQADGGKGRAFAADITREEDLKQVFLAIENTLGGIHIIIANAGTNSDRRRIEDSVPDDFRATIETNLIGTYLTVRTAIPFLKKCGGGHIVTIGSGLGQKGTAGTGAYACSKAGVHILTQLLSCELKEFGIAVNELIPGPVKTELSKPIWNREDSVFKADEWVKNPEDISPLLMTILSMHPAKCPSGQAFSLMARVV